MEDEVQENGRGALRYLTRYTKEFTSFDGWRVALTRCGVPFVRYFSVGKYGCEQVAFEAARRLRDALLRDLERCALNDKDAIMAVFNTFRARKVDFPAGFRAPVRSLPVARAAEESGRMALLHVRLPFESKACVAEAASRVGVDVSTFIRVGVYLLLWQVARMKPEERNAFSLERLLLEWAGQGGELPSFAEFSYGRKETDNADA